jgi:ribosome-associated protein
VLLDTFALARDIVDVLEDKKGEDIILMDIRDLTTFADYFVICSGGSRRTVNALADAVREDIKSRYRTKGRLEGLPEDGWVLVDFGDVVLHIFSPDQRDYYRLEELWHEGKILLRLQ